jgi:hypothetical protein
MPQFFIVRWLLSTQARDFSCAALKRRWDDFVGLQL